MSATGSSSGEQSVKKSVPPPLKQAPAKSDKVEQVPPAQAENKRVTRRTLYGMRTKVSPSARAKAIETSDV